MDVSNKTPKLVVVKDYESKLDGEKVRLLMYCQGQKYGVVSHHMGAAVARDYKNGDSSCELRTHIENEADIIDWVAINLAKERYQMQLMSLLEQNNNGQPIFSGKPILRLVSHAK